MEFLQDIQCLFECICKNIGNVVFGDEPNKAKCNEFPLIDMERSFLNTSQLNYTRIEIQFIYNICTLKYNVDMD